LRKLIKTRDSIKFEHNRYKTLEKERERHVLVSTKLTDHEKDT
jgi:hypothetical protein